MRTLAPYIVQRGRTYYLRVRVPVDVAPLAGQSHFVRSLRTTDPKKARGEAARLLTVAHRTWDSLRREVAVMKVKFFPGKDPAAYTGQEYEGQEVTLTQLRRRAKELLGEPYEEPPMPQTPEELERHIMARARMIADNAARNHKTAEAHQLQIAAMLAEELREQRARGTMAVAAAAADPYEGLDREGATKPFTEHLRPYLDTIGKRSDSTISGYEKTFERMEALLGSKATADVDTLDVERFYRSLVDTKTDKGANKGEAYLAYDTIYKSISNVRAFFKWAVSKHYAHDNPARKVVVWKETYEDEAEDGPARRPFTPDELSRLFDAPLFTGCKSESRVYEPGRVVVRNHKFFFPLVGFLTGMRLSEIRQLEFEDLITLNGRLHFSVNRVSHHGHKKTTKTTSSFRQIPVHDDLVRCGLLEYVEARKEGASDGRIFPDFRYSNWWNQCFLPSLDLKTDQLCFHSLRHGFRDLLREATPSQEAVDRLMGHWREGTGKIYGSRDLLPSETAVIESVRPPVTLAHLFCHSLNR